MQSILSAKERNWLTSLLKSKSFRTGKRKKKRRKNGKTKKQRRERSGSKRARKSRLPSTKRNRQSRRTYQPTQTSMTTMTNMATMLTIMKKMQASILTRCLCNISSAARILILITKMKTKSCLCQLVAKVDRGDLHPQSCDLSISSLFHMQITLLQIFNLVKY